jgi:hypothetical protein
MSIKLQHRTEHTFKKEVTISDANQIDHNKSGIIYIGDGFLANNHIDFENNEFVELLRSEIWPIIPIDKINLPEDHYTVALHVRRGGGYDHQLYQKDTIVNIRSKYADRNYPKRFPPDSFYIDQLKYVAALHADKKIYVHIFTDDPKPSTIAKKIETAVGNPRLTFGYRTKANRHDKNVLTDFFNMMNFDCLIRADSNYSEMAGSIGRLSLEIAPAEHFWHGKELSITEKKLISRTEGKTVIEYEKK